MWRAVWEGHQDVHAHCSMAGCPLHVAWHGHNADMALPLPVQVILSGIIAGVGHQKRGSAINTVAYWCCAVSGLDQAVGLCERGGGQQDRSGRRTGRWSPTTAAL